MYPNISDLRSFYDSGLGDLPRRFIRAQLRKLWPNVGGLNVLGLGYATPHLRIFAEEAQRVLAFMPAQQGTLPWPAEGPNATALVEETALPLPEGSIDRLLIVHALENTQNIGALLQEAWRVLAGQGRMIIVVPKRGGFWAMDSSNPFGFGFSFSLGHIRRLLAHHRFEVSRCRRALFVPPFAQKFLAPSAGWIENFGAHVLPALAGVLVIEVSKQVYARPPAEKARIEKPVLLPLPELIAPSPTTGRWS
ncbi:MAG TPA: methyltransferase domain-containing protein [Alphaproteobacteria bacterium]|nr:methyltransferase domain-containing protein [Alphaproteobacteria bacterium]